jgi:CHAT domain-containing protein
VEYFQQADALLEDIRTRSVDTNFRASVFSIRRDMYAAWISKIIDSTRSGARGSPAEDNKFLALALSERSRGRALKDMLEIYQRANTKNTRLPDFLISSSVDEVLTGTELLSPNANNKKTSLQSTPNRAEPTPSLSDTVASLRSFQSSLSESTTVVQYLLGKETSYAWVLRRNSLDLVILPSAARIKAAIDNATSELLKTGSSSDQRKVLGRVYDLIFEPLEQHLANGDLIISPDDSLYALPFAALWDAHRGKYLVERFAISYVPSLHASIGKINVNATPTTQERALIVGDAIYNRSDFAVRCLGQTQSAQRAAQPSVKASLEFERLISSGTETRQVTALIQQHGIDAVSLSECSATRERVLQELRQPLSYVHLATHASVNLTVPQYSAIYLTSFSGSGESIGGLLTVQDLVREKLATKLVVLTGCSTGGGRRFAGESPIGLTFAILAAGSKQVLSTSWPAADAPTAEAMTTFYQRLLNERDSAAQALRQAQLSLLRSARWKSPRYWAPFTIFGLPVESDRAQTGFTRST